LALSGRVDSGDFCTLRFDVVMMLGSTPGRVVFPRIWPHVLADLVLRFVVGFIAGRDW
jgi:hypothetical protein